MLYTKQADVGLGFCFFVQKCKLQNFQEERKKRQEALNDYDMELYELDSASFPKMLNCLALRHTLSR